ncbi:MAG: Lrp/AsnC family transcriptional regulator [Alphaproteobacteria bacterium]|nr:Lrp/AsnC family transcriptional regulator [Alphaproteobacteria bacterium]MBU6473424.1 Lrp/AsnC family transcriptional regulator [Alphaproteobacteria bacterium]MDE2012090.1 Lrp/AsnC family transcriptional regulator [Alphaproteobacteria bacterium]MDE2073387.1 Lrp/AsnC family transcriptional regulator [Alphaproteobacteria bacterium]
MEKLDNFDLKILTVLQQAGSLSQRELADRIGLSQNACWRRLQRLQASGIIRESRVAVDLPALGLDLTVFVLIRTRHHSMAWAETFRKHVERLHEVTDFYRIGGECDYLIKAVTRGMPGYDAFYQKLITGFDFLSVQGIFSMEAILESRAIDLTRRDNHGV